MEPMKRKQKPRKYGLSDEQIAKLSDEKKQSILANYRNFEDSATGWSPIEAALFRLALTKYGCGNWDLVAHFLPHHNTAQLNVFCQKLMGQQGLFAFTDIPLDPYDVFLKNSQTPGLRKSGVKVHEGPPMTSAR